jgi:hypothetical protein
MKNYLALFLYLEECQADGKPLPPRETDELSVGIVQAN